MFDSDGRTNSSFRNSAMIRRVCERSSPTGAIGEVKLEERFEVGILRRLEREVVREMGLLEGLLLSRRLLMVPEGGPSEGLSLGEGVEVEERGGDGLLSEVESLTKHLGVEARIELGGRKKCEGVDRWVGLIDRERFGEGERLWVDGLKGKETGREGARSQEKSSKE